MKLISAILIFIDTFSGNVGLAISQALILTGMVQFGIRQITETMQQMTSVERIIEYTQLEPVIYRIFHQITLFESHYCLESFDTGTKSR